MQKVQRNQKNEDAKKVVMLVAKLNQYRHEYVVVKHFCNAYG